MKKYGFTLAEILITLGIIGVVAALTMPSLIHKQRNKALEAQFKKTYSMLAQVLLRVSVDEPDFYNDITGMNSVSGAITKLKPALIKYMNVAKDYNNKDYIDTLQEKYTNYDGKLPLADASWGYVGQFVLSDGTMIFTECTSMCTPAIIIADLTGPEKGPNRAGYDLFAFAIGSKMELLPYKRGDSEDKASRFYGFSNAEKALSEPDYFKNLP
ncbi:MAG: type II secretion system GspH family protein [Heliobacteriaceae bacterium]|jgi:prepilin-type N-terminal cleavage/methylation domain-containing protein|nr:type II secretion system GspH family protein [Heliobacteriaceae bacterium]